MKKQIQLQRMLKKFLGSSLVFVTFLTLLFSSCKKQLIDQTGIDSTSPQIEAFLKLPESPSPELKIITGNLRKELIKNNFIPDFLNWHGQPLWDKAIGVKVNADNFSLYIPTKKENADNISTYFIATYRKGHVLYEMHRRSYLNTNTKEPTIFNYTKRDFAKTLAYFDDIILNKKDTIFLNNSLDHPGFGGIKNTINGNYNQPDASQNPSGNLRVLCHTVTIEVPCESSITPSSSSFVYQCYIDVQECTILDDGGDSGGGGTGGGGTGGGGGGTGGEEPCPYNYSGQWYSNNIFSYCENELLDNFSYPGGICYIENGTAGPGITQHTRDHVLRGEVKNGKGTGGHSQNALGITVRWQIGTNPTNGPNNMKKGKIDVKNPTNGQWYAKSEPTSMFPSNWSDTKIIDEINYVFNHKTKRAPINGLPNNHWEGWNSDHTVFIRMYLNPPNDPNGEVITAFPVF